MPDTFNILDANQYVAGPAGGSASLNLLKPTGSLAETFPRSGGFASANVALLTSGTLRLTAIALPANVLVSSVTFLSATTALSAGTNQWFALFDSARALLAVTADDTSTAWAANAPKTLNLGTPYRTTSAGLYYLGIMVAASTPPTLTGVTATGGGMATLTPAIGGNSTTGMTTPPTIPTTAGAITASAAYPYAYVS